MRKKKVLLTLFLVILFLCVYTTIDFFHNHKTLEDLPSCPACHFAHIFMSLLPQVLIFLSSLLLIEIIIRFPVLVIKILLSDIFCPGLPRPANLPVYIPILPSRPISGLESLFYQLKLLRKEVDHYDKQANWIQ